MTHDPPSALEETLASLAAQDYPDLSVIVVGSAAAPPGDGPSMGEIVDRVLPGATALRLVGPQGYGTLANEVLAGGAAADAAAGADYLLFCQDDVVLDPTAVRGLAETAVQTGAGVAGPKIVDVTDPRKLLHMGITCTATGVVVPLVERGELDQGQHDGQREVYAVGGGATLVSGRLFRRIGGFDEAVSWLGDSLSLCWRARLAGARVVVTSSARARHGEVLRDRVSESVWRQLKLRHRIRLVATCTGRLRRWFLLPALVLVAFVQTCAALVAGRFGEAGRLATAWPWNLRRWWSVIIARRQVRRFRRVKDRDLRALRVSGPSLLALYFRRERRARGLPTDDSGAALPASNGARRNDVAGRWQAARRQLTAWSPGAVVATLALAGVMLAGGRHLLTRGVPEIGDLVGFETPGILARGWWTGWRSVGLGADTAVPALQPALAAAGTLVGGSMGLLRTLLTLGLVPVGLIGSFRMMRNGGAVRSVGSPRAAVGAAVAYAALPLPYLALAGGRWQPLVVYAVAPWWLTRLGLAAGRPVGAAADDPPVPHLGRDLLSLGLITGVAGLVVPTAPFLLVGLAGVLAVAGLLVAEFRGILRMLVAALGASVLALVLHLPWTVAAATGGGRGFGEWWGVVRSPAPLADTAAGPGVGALPLGLDDTPALWALLGAAGFALLVGRAWRLSWAARGWIVALTTYGLVWATGPSGIAGMRNLPMPAPELLLALAGVGLAVAVGCSVATIERDVVGRSRRLGIRRLAAGAALVALAGATVPTVVLAVEGDWGMPRSDFAPLLREVDREVADADTRVLWAGGPDALPGQGWRAQPPLFYTTTWGHARPAAAELLPGPAADATRQIEGVLDAVQSGETSRAGSLLAPLAVEYIAVPLASGPSGSAPEDGYTPDTLLDGLSGQLDLRRVALDPSLVVYRNLEVLPGLAALPRRDAPWATTAVPVDEVASETDRATPVLPDGSGHVPAATGRSGPLEGDTLVLPSLAASPHWQLTVDGVAVAREPAYGWAEAYLVAEDGVGELTHTTPWSYRALLVAQVVAWLGTIVALAAVRARVAKQTPQRERAGDRTPPAKRWIAIPAQQSEYVRILGPGTGQLQPAGDPVHEPPGPEPVVAPGPVGSVEPVEVVTVVGPEPDGPAAPAAASESDGSAATAEPPEDGEGGTGAQTIGPVLTPPPPALPTTAAPTPPEGTAPVSASAGRSEES